MLSTALLLAASMVVGQNALSSTTEAQFKEYGQSMVGSWTGEATLAADWQGFGAKGEKITGEAVSKWILGKKAIQGSWKLGGAKGKSLTVWCPASKQIKVFQVHDSGDFTEAIITREGDKWAFKYAGESAEGKTISGASTLTVADDGQTTTFDEGDQTRGDDTVPGFRHAWRRTND